MLLNKKMTSFKIAEVHFKFDGGCMVLWELLPCSSLPGGSLGRTLAGTDGLFQLLFKGRRALHNCSEGHGILGANLHEPLENMVVHLPLLLGSRGAHR